MSEDNTAWKICAYADGLAYADLSPRAIHCAKRSILDSIGCALGAFDQSPVKAIRALAAEITAARPATIIGTDIRSSPELAGFANGAMIRFLDFSDDYFGGTGIQAGPHPSDNIGSLLAASESADADARSFILATVLAYEICDQLVDCTALHPQGWDYTVLHSAATAVAAGKILGLAQDQLRNALGLAVVSNVSLWQTRIGELSNWKGLAGPNGSRNGLFAALLAKQGITGPAEPFEGKAGFMRQLNSPFQLGELGGNGNPFKIERTFFKWLPVMYSAQLPIAAALELRKKVSLDDIETMVLHVYGYMLSTGAYAPERWEPTTPEMADHSSPYLISAALVDGRIDARTMTPERYRDPTILNVARKLRVEEDPSYSAAYPRALNCRLDATLKSSRVISVHQTNPKGHPDNAMSDAELETKFFGQVDGKLTAEQSRRLLDMLWELENVDDLRQLMSAMVVQR